MIATRLRGSAEVSDTDLVAGVREGDDAAFEELYGRYRARIASYVRGMVRDQGRAEDLTQEVFLSALRRLRETDSEIAFKAWIYRIASNAAIDHHRRTSRAQEISMDGDAGLRPSDHARLVQAGAPDSALVAKERLDHLCGAFDELTDDQARVIVLRELEGLSYREISERLNITRPAVESALFRARRRLESEYEELSEGRRCAGMRTTIARLAEGVGGNADEARLARHARRCSLCRRRARELGVEPQTALGRVRRKVAALLPFPWAAQGGTGPLGGLIGERAAALAAIAAIGAGGAAVGVEKIGGGPERPAVERGRAAEQRDLGPVSDSSPLRSRDAARSTVKRPVRRAGSARARRKSDARTGARPRTRQQAPSGVSTAPARPAGGGGAAPAPAPQPSAPAAPQLPDVRSVLPRVPSGQGGVSVPEVPSVQLPQPPPPTQPGAVSVPPQVVNGANDAVDGVTDKVNGALP
jgi:RNA polymerase sigma factor (sigma-70 family)